MGRIYFLVTILCSLISSVPAKPVRDSAQPSVHQVLEGKDIRIECKVNETAEVDIFWIKNETKSDFRQNGTELYFNNIHRSSTGDYICYSLNETAETNASIVEVVKIDVLYPAEIVEFYVNSTINIQNNWFNVFCNVTGNPTPDYIVMNNQTKHVDIQVHASAAVGEEVLATCESAGTWICSGRNSLNKGKNVTRSANVTVFCGPHPNYNTMENRYEVRATLGVSTFLIMENYGNPYPIYTWKHNDMVLSPDRHTDFGFASFLNISNVRVQDYGTYELLMTNTYGIYQTTYQLIPIGPPERPTNLRFSEVTHNSVRLEWTAGFDMGSTQHFTVLRFVDDIIYKISPSIYEYSVSSLDTDISHLVTDLEPDTWYLLDVAAENSYGVQVLSNRPVEFRTAAAPTTTTTTTLAPFLQLHTRLAIILGSTLGGLALLGLLALLFYVVKYRNMKTSYKMMKETTKRAANNGPPLQLAITPEMKKVALT